MSNDLSSQILKQEMNKSNITIEQLSKVTGIDLEKVYKYLDPNDTSEMTMREAKKFCDFFNISLDYFIGVSNIRGWSFTLGNEKFESNTFIFENSCQQFVEYLKSKELVKVEEIL
jgi:hypothetical protein